MNWKKTICPLVALAVSAALCYVSAAAAVEEYPIAAKYQQDRAITALTAREGGSLDYFSRTRCNIILLMAAKPGALWIFPHIKII